MPLFKVKKTGEIGYFSDKLRPSYDLYKQKVYYFLRMVDPSTDWSNAYAPNQYKFTGKTGRYEAGELTPISSRELKKNQKINLPIKEDVELAKSDITKIIDYSEKLQSMFDVNDNLEDWIKAKLNHAADYVMTVRDYIKFYSDEKNELQEIKNKYKKDDIDKIVDGLQYALDIVGIEPTIGTVADATNSIISILRAALEKETDDKKKHLLNAAISAVSMIPFGDLVKLIKLRVLRKPAVKLAKFIKQFLKSTDPSYADDMLEVWSNRYKRSINCSNPRGFSQKAHCRARKLRQSGKQTSSKPVKEIYKEIINGLLKEYNSSMAMGSLKQINHDAKELQSILQQTDELEDWVKAKLNLAGEYLDDIYHHLDHFKNKTTITESFYEKKLWFTPDGKVVDVGNSHEKWILKNDPSVAKGMTLIDTYENAIKKGYVRSVHDVSSNFLTLSNLPNYDFSEKSVSKNVKNAIEDYVVDKNIDIVASGKGNILRSFAFKKPELSTFESSNKEMQEGWKDLAMAGALGLASLQGGALAGQQPSTTKHTQTVQSKESFIDYMKRVENAGRVGYDAKKRLWFPHKSVEGGSDTIAYGHKIQPGEDFSKGITDQQAVELLKKDIETAKSIVYKELKNRKLTPKQEEMFVDFVFNMGTLRKFPKFTQAVLKNDVESMKKQFKRFVGDKELKGRNTSFLKRFLTEYFGFNYYF